MSLEALSSEDKSKLKRVIDEGLRVTQEVTDLRESLRDLVKSVAEELQIKPAELNRAIRSAFKSSIQDEQETVDNVAEILHLVGRG